MKLQRLFLPVGILLPFSVFLIIIPSIIFNIEPPITLIIVIISLGVMFQLLGVIFTLTGNKVKNGVLAIGTIVSLERTGTLVNHQPQVDITIEFTTTDGEHITASERRVVSLTDLAQVQPGAMIPIRYDSKNPQNIMIDTNADKDSLQDVYNRQMVEKGVTSQETLDIANNGVKAKGVILSAEPTGNIINDMGEMTLHIKVTPPDNGDTFEAFVNKVIPANMLLSTQPGSVIEVFYLPEDESKIAISLNLS